jgi:trehalose 6-phosphate synthase
MFGFGDRHTHTRALELTRSTAAISPSHQRVIVLANRAPIRHDFDAGGQVIAKRSTGGLVTALEPLVETYSGTWVAHAAGTADARHVGARGGLNVPPAKARYRVRYVPLAEDEHRGYYFGFANEGLWPLCHAVGVEPAFRPCDFDDYRSANLHFAAAVADEARGEDAIVLVQDYHLALAPRLIRRRMPSSAVVAFWHIPWPRARTFRTCPWACELLEGLLGSDIVGFQTEDDCMNFLGCVESLPDAQVDLLHGAIRYQGRVTKVRAYPVGIDWANPVVRSLPSPAVCREGVFRDLQLPWGVKLGVGIDRLDYTKGLNEKFLAIEHLLETRPSLRGDFVFVQVAEPSRDCLPAYRAARAQLLDTSQRINGRFGTDSYQPIRLLEEHHEPVDVYRYYRSADLCHVGSLHDGMNLVAKEFVAAREDERGVLVLSQFAGAARQLRAAVLVNPLSVDQSAAALGEALAMPAIEQAKRMRVLRANVETCDASCWARQIVHDAMLNLHRGRAVEARNAERRMSA